MMPHDTSNCKALFLRITVLLLITGCAPHEAGARDETEVLHITVGAPTKLSDVVYQNTASLMVSRTGVVAAFYPKTGTGPKFYRISTDRGATWSPEMDGPPELNGGADCGTLRDGGVIMPVGETRPAADGEEGWYEKGLLRFTDDMKDWELETARMYVPDAGPVALDHVAFPTLAKGKMVQLPDGDVLAPAYSMFKGDNSRRVRAYLLRSQDQGRTWRYHATIAHEPIDPNPQLPGQYVGACEPSITLLGDGRMLAMLRTQYAHPPAEYKPMAVCWSADEGATWTTPQASQPHLMCISPTLATLDNGVVACEYGRPGFHVVFSLDDGQTWQDRISFSHQIEPMLTGQFDLIKSGPNDLVAIGSNADGTHVWLISVKRVAESPGRADLAGRVVDERGRPVAGALVERGKNRYAVEDWVVDPLGWGKRVRRGNNHPERKVPVEYIPRLSYRSIQKSNGYPTVRTDDEGHYVFEDTALGEYVLTVESEGHAPGHRRVKVGPQSKSEDFSFAPGRLVRGRVVDAEGGPVGGACVVLNKWHCHTDPLGVFHWSLEAPVPQEVTVHIYKKYSSRYKETKTTLALSQFEAEPIVLKGR
jgi:protocatechuate 3,4-dioxygenase beta subunit